MPDDMTLVPDALVEPVARAIYAAEHDRLGVARTSWDTMSFAAMADSLDVARAAIAAMQPALDAAREAGRREERERIAAVEPDMWWDDEDPEVQGCDAEEIAVNQGYNTGEVFKVQCAHRAADRWVAVVSPPDAEEIEVCVFATETEARALIPPAPFQDEIIAAHREGRDG